MPKRINWKKGMRLSDEVMRRADDYCAADLGQTAMLAAAGRFGLFPAGQRPFQLSLSLTNNYVDVESLSCLAITRDGHVIDVHYDTRFEQWFETRVPIPEDDDQQEYLLAICAVPDKWHETGEGIRETAYAYVLLAKNEPLPFFAMPIGRIVKNNEGWAEDNANFVPPCLFVSSHKLMEELHARFLDIMRSIMVKTRQQLDTGARTAISIYWPLVQQTFIAVNTRHDVMTPMDLLAHVQQVVAAFTCACELDEMLQLEDAATFSQFAQLPYNYQSVYFRLKQGLGMCYAISEKVEKFSLLQPEEPQPERKPQPQAPAGHPDPRRLWDGKCI